MFSIVRLRKLFEAINLTIEMLNLLVSNSTITLHKIASRQRMEKEFR